MVRQHNEAFQIILLQRHRKFYDIIIFLSGMQKKFQRANATDIAWDGNDPPDNWLKMGSAQYRTHKPTRGSSIL